MAAQSSEEYAISLEEIEAARIAAVSQVDALDLQLQSLNLEYEASKLEVEQAEADLVVEAEARDAAG